MGELHGDEMRREYDVGGPKVYLLEDGERYWYVARSPQEALRAHVEDFGGEEVCEHPGEAVELTLQAPDAMLTLGEDEGDPWPTYWQWELAKPGEPWALKVTATHAEWAAYYAALSPQERGWQIGTSCI